MPSKHGVEPDLVYELWDTATGNCIGRYASDVEALARVRELVEHLGVGYADELQLTSENRLGEVQNVRGGERLLASAATVVAHR